MPRATACLLLVLVSLLTAACLERDLHATTERIWRRGTMIVGLPEDADQRSYAQLVYLERLAARLGARLDQYPARVPDLCKALGAGVIDVVAVPVVATPPGADPADAYGRGLRAVDVREGGETLRFLVCRDEQAFACLLGGVTPPPGSTPTRSR